jgi:DNA-binding NarL/FixJ family response regulator
MANKSIKILIVDDQKIWREYVEDYLQDAIPHIEIFSAVSSDDAIERVNGADFDLILLDMRMPSGTEGLDALRQIREIKPQAQVIMMSAYGEIETAVEAMRRGAIDFIPKGDPSSSDPTAFLDVLQEKVKLFQRTAAEKLSLIASREQLIVRAHEDAYRFTDIQEKGKALEDLAAALFQSVHGFTINERNCKTETEEIDIVILNESPHPFWRDRGSLLLVECKNWHSQKVGKNEFVLFKEKIQNRSGICKLGFLICTELFAETITKEMLRGSREDTLIVPIDKENLQELTRSPNRDETLKQFVINATKI